LTLLSLPEELVLVILRHLSILDVAGSLRGASRDLRSVIDRNGGILFRLLRIGSRGHPGMKVLADSQFRSPDHLAMAFSRLRPVLHHFVEMTVFDAAAFPADLDLARMTGLGVLSMDTYDFLRLEPPQLALVTDHLVALRLAGKFVAFHEARKVLAKVTAVSRLREFKTDNLMEPHLRLRASDLSRLSSLQFITVLGVIFDTFGVSEADTEDLFWDGLDSLPALRVFAAGIADLSHASRVAALIAWLPAECHSLFVQFAGRSNPLMSVMHPLRPLLGPRRPRLRELRLDMGDTMVSCEELEADLRAALPLVDVRVGPGTRLVDHLFFSDSIFAT